ncbi:hypothetical protein BK008_04935 [Methanobacterium sp. MZ-A1]|nr:hypothetical protein BK008_04935 [Methanobacterium sp. MZ-A1]PKL72787.1 MAG: hypothetical protein CVV29_06915 [Methanobacteriales archaeon HGW-Methanobacteriales-2]
MSIIFIISIIFLLIIGILSYLGNPSNLCRIPLIFVLLIVIIYSIFDLMKYYNKKVYVLVITMLLVIMWVIGLIALFTQIDEITCSTAIYYLEVGLITFLFFLSVPFTFKGKL